MKNDYCDLVFSIHDCGRLFRGLQVLPSEHSVGSPPFSTLIDLNHGLFSKSKWWKRQKGESVNGMSSDIFQHGCFIWLVVTGTMEFYMTFHSVGNFITPTDFHIFQRGWNQQPVMVCCFLVPTSPWSTISPLKFQWIGLIYHPIIVCQLFAFSTIYPLYPPKMVDESKKSPICSSSQMPFFYPVYPYYGASSPVCRAKSSILLVHFQQPEEGIRNLCSHWLQRSRFTAWRRGAMAPKRGGAMVGTPATLQGRFRWLAVLFLLQNMSITSQLG